MKIYYKLLNYVKFKRAIKMRKDTLLIVILLLLITGGLVYLNLDFSQYSLAYIVSGSMEPTYYKGDLIIMKRARASEIDLGDVIIFKSPRDSKILILHRVVAIKFVDGKYYFLTKGDNPRTNRQIDFWGWVPEDNLIGKLIYRFPFLGALAEFLSINYIRYTLILIISILFLLSLLEEKNEKMKGKKNRIGSHKREFSLKIIVIITLICLSNGLTLLMLNNEANYDVSLEKMDLYRLYDETSGEYINYVTLTLSVKSIGYWIGSIKEMKVSLFIRYRDTNLSLSDTIWTIAYYFYGAKKISICLLLNDTALQMLINSDYEEILCKVQLYIESIISGKMQQEKIIHVSRQFFY